MTNNSKNIVTVIPKYNLKGCSLKIKEQRPKQNSHIT